MPVEDSRLSERPAPSGLADPPPLFEAPGLSDRVDAAIIGLSEMRSRPQVAVAAAMVALLVVAAGWWWGRSPAPEEVELTIPLAAAKDVGSPADSEPPPSSDEPEVATTVATILVHVVGEVATPGIVELDGGARVIDAVEEAGGPTAGADVHRLNLAEQLTDGSQLRVPAVDELVDGPLVVPGAAPGLGGPAVGREVDLNRATATELESLPGIGPSLAAAIIEWRQQHGPFAMTDDLLAVPGIGPAKLEALRDLVSP